MKETRIEFRLSHKEKRELEKLCKKYDFSFGEYIRRKLFHENSDYDEFNERYVSPEVDKNNLITISIIYKIYYLLIAVLENQGVVEEEVENLKKNSLEFARKQRLNDGYKIIKS